VKSEVEYIARSFNKILNLIEDCNVGATFCVVGEIAEKYPEILEKISFRERSPNSFVEENF